MLPDDSIASEFKQAAWFKRWVSPVPREILWIVIHDAEVARSDRTAEALANVAASPTSRHASWHYAADNDTVTQSVYESDIAWAAGPTGNLHGIHIEIEGYAYDAPDVWTGDRALQLSAGLAFSIGQRWSIPLDWVDVDGAMAFKRGLISHATLSQAFHESDHHDPGTNFPYAQFRSMALLGY
jgi:N-acetyl-anhydromuramyl-L-alanine amidase AmpD